MNKPLSHRLTRPGALDHERRRAAVPVGESRRSPARKKPAPSCSSTARPWPRSRPSICRCRGGRARWIISRRKASTPGASTWRAMAAPTRSAASTATIAERRRRSRRRHRLHPEDPQHRAAAGLRHFLGRVARRSVRPAPSRSRETARARRPRMDRRRQPHAGAAPQEAPRIHQDQAPPDRPRLRALDLRARPSRHRRRQRDRGLRRRHPQARRFDPERHLYRHVQQSAGGRPDQDQGADHHHARRVRRHRLHSTICSRSSSCCRIPTSNSP